MIHPARNMPFDELHAGLEAARAAGTVVSKQCPAGRTIYVYSARCVYESAWDRFSLMARGLILHPRGRRVLATPFPKFFNVGERGLAIPDLPFEVFEKVDGSLAIIHQFDGAWRAATKGAFDSAQAAWVETRLRAQDLSALVPGATYLAEAVYPENRIVIRYGKPELVLLAAYLEDGTEVPFDALGETADALGWRVARRHAFDSFSALVEHARGLPKTEEGFVIRFIDGLRLKLKGDEYKRIHALISRCTPLAMWEAMQAGDDLQAIRRDLPEEFWGDFDAITAMLQRRLDEVTARVAAAAAEAAHLSDKELGLRLRSLDPQVRPFIFHWRKDGGRLAGRARDGLFRTVRPTGNVLEGYAPSYAMGRVIDDAL
jgi:RNA ligase